MIMSVFDPSGAEILRQNRSILSGTITDMINEYGPKAFPDFDGNTNNITSKYIRKLKKKKKKSIYSGLH